MPGEISSKHGSSCGTLQMQELATQKVSMMVSVILCRGWREKRLNPGGIRVRQREYKHEPVSSLRDIRQLSQTSTHKTIDTENEMEYQQPITRLPKQTCLQD